VEGDKETLEQQGLLTSVTMRGHAHRYIFHDGLHPWFLWFFVPSAALPRFGRIRIWPAFFRPTG
jgi:hypothetical protein